MGPAGSWKLHGPPPSPSAPGTRYMVCCFSPVLLLGRAGGSLRLLVVATLKHYSSEQTNRYIHPATAEWRKAVSRGYTYCTFQATFSNTEQQWENRWVDREELAGGEGVTTKGHFGRWWNCFVFCLWLVVIVCIKIHRPVCQKKKEEEIQFYCVLL